ncbi:MAG TPA: cytochrome c oxidase assembly factor Coa1 family protein [Polyangiales bacterium]|nr:cytochrome c oxidase assembly factor Coa1 family protein [Polyangiales bacterium]
MQNTSGQGAGAVVPPEIDRWNWGAFLLNWIWGIGNNTLIALLAFVPCVGLAMPIVLGLRGSAWAWQNKRWESVEEFRRVQRTWAITGLAVTAVVIGAAVLGVGAILYGLKQTDVYKAASQRVASDPQVVAALGSPIETGYPQGNIEATPASGKAQLRFSVQGPRGEGTAYVDATKDMGRWTFSQLELELDGKPERLVLLPAQ